MTQSFKNVKKDSFLLAFPLNQVISWNVNPSAQENLKPQLFFNCFNRSLSVYKKVVYETKHKGDDRSTCYIHW